MRHLFYLTAVAGMVFSSSVFASDEAMQNIKRQMQSEEQQQEEGVRMGRITPPAPHPVDTYRIPPQGDELYDHRPRGMIGLPLAEEEAPEGARHTHIPQLTPVPAH